MTFHPQTQEVFSQCGVSFGNGRVGRRQADDDSEDDDEESSSSNIPLLPDVVRTAARALRGGPFEYNGECVSVCVCVGGGGGQGCANL